MRHRPHVVEDFMTTAVIALGENDRVSRAVQEMTLCSIRHLPVVDGKGKIVGILSSHDVVGAHERGGDPTVRAIMTRVVATVRPDTLAREALDLMLDGKFNALPVVGGEGELVGIITSTDFLGVARHALEGARLDRSPA